MESIEQMNLSYCQLSYSISKSYLNTYDPICSIKNCLVCTNKYVKPAYIYLYTCNYV